MVRAVLRDRRVLSAVGAGVVIAVCVVLTWRSSPWPLGVIAAIWLVASAVYVRDALRAYRATAAGPGSAPVGESDDEDDERRR